MNLESGVMQIHVEDIIPNRFQPRLNFDEQALNELADSIREHGIIQPLVLRKLGDKYEIIAGERRYKAAQMVGLTTVPAVIANVDDNTAAEAAIVENVQRSNLTAIEEARSYKNLLDKGYLTQEQLAKKMGLSQPAVANKLRLLQLDEEVQEALLEEKISERHARTLLSIKDKEEQKEWLHRIINERLTVRQLDMEIKKDLEEKGLLGITDDENEEVPLVESARSVDDIRNSATDINGINDRMADENMVKPEEVTEEVETLEPVPVEPPFKKVEPQELPDDVEPYNPDRYNHPEKYINQDEDNNESSDGGFIDASSINNDEPPRENHFINEPNDDNFVTATSVPESSIVTPESSSSFVPQDDFVPSNNDNNKFFSYNGPSEPVEDDGPQMESFGGPAKPDNFEVYNDPSAGKFINASDENPFDEPEMTPAAPEPIKEEQNLNTAFDVNPNNKFFKPVYDTKNMENMDMKEEKDRIVDPMDSIEKITPEYREKQQEEKAASLKDAIEAVRKTIERLGDQGFYINVEEIDFDTNYQITIQIEKDE